MRSSNGPLKLFIGNIGNNNKSDLSRAFSKYGEISTIYVDEKKNFAFVEFTSASDGERALQHINNKPVNGSRLRVEYAKSDKVSRDNRRPISRERSPTASFYNHLQVTANRLPVMDSMRHNYYQNHPIAMMPASAMSRGRSLTPPSFKQNARVSSMSHLRSQDFYPPYYPHHPAVYTDPAYYRAYGDPYLMQRLPPPPSAFFRSTSPSSSSRAPRHMYPSSDYDHPPPVSSHKRSSRRNRSRSPRRNSPARRDRSSRDKKRKRRTSSSVSPKHQRDRGPQTPPTTHRTKKRSRSDSNTGASISERKSPSTSSSSSSEDENNDDKQSDSKRSQNNGSDRKHSRRKTRE
ncbi:hypothetical protein I4U23_007276 [Adineta vaga]|nr:hypothetical protein I4U23_007276 [Adineta vaga]